MSPSALESDVPKQSARTAKKDIETEGSVTIKLLLQYETWRTRSFRELRRTRFPC